MHNKRDIKICSECGKPGKVSDMNFLFGKYAHKNCDDEILDKQEKKVRYLDKLQSEQHF